MILVILKRSYRKGFNYGKNYCYYIPLLFSYDIFLHFDFTLYLVVTFFSHYLWVYGTTQCLLLCSEGLPLTWSHCRVLARISKMTLQNCNFKMSARPNLATNLLQILITTTFNSLLCQKGNSNFSYVLEDGLFGKYVVITPKMSKLKILYWKFCLSKKEVFRKLPVQKTCRTGPA